MSTAPARERLPRLLFVFAALLALAVLSRVLPHPPNFTALDAIALYAGVRLLDRRAAFALPLLAMLISDAIIGFHGLMWLVYLCMGFTVWLGMLARKRGALAVGLAGVLGATVFFLTTNVAVWAGSGMYTQDLAGLSACITAALPFYQWSLAGLAAYGALLWAVDALLRPIAPQLAWQAPR